LNDKPPTAVNPHTDGQTEEMNTIMEQYLITLINYQQNNRMLWLPMAEFASNNHTSETTWCSLFFGNYGFHLRRTFSLHPVQNGNDISKLNANTLSQRMNQIFQQMKTEMARAQSIQAEQADKYRWEGVELKPGHRVWMDARNISTQRLCKKLDWKHLGPYKGLEVVSSWAY
jgi:hypothetical protein